MSRAFSTVGVVGLGTMGAGIAEVFARSGLAVVGVEQSEELLERGRGHLIGSTDRAVRRGRLEPADQQAILDRLTLTSSLSGLADCDLVVEAVVERLDLKLAIFTQLDDIVRPDAVLATNTSSLSVTRIATATAHPGRVIGMHFFNPAPVQRLVEVVHTVLSDESVVDGVQALARRLGKSPVVVGDRAGFIANALLFGYLNNAAAMFESRAASREDLDAAMTLGCGYPLGPLALLDLIGLDTAHEILQTMYAESGDRLHAPTPVLRQMVTAGMLGRKSGRGFYTYDRAHGAQVVPDALTPAADAAAEQRAVEQGPVEQRPVEKVGVVGSGPGAGPVADALGAACVDAGYDVVRAAGVDDPALSDLASTDLVVVVVDDGDAHVDGSGASPDFAVFERLGALCKDGAILATTSGLPVVDVAAASGRPQDVVGMHLVGAETGGSLVEVVSTVATRPEAAATVRAVARSLGRHPISCGDRAGFVVDALLFPYLNDAVRMLAAGYATADDIDTAMTKGCALPKGPIAMLDDIGTDVVLAGQRRIYAELREPGLTPAPLLAQLVTAGRLGHSTGQGFRTHSHD